MMLVEVKVKVETWVLQTLFSSAEFGPVDLSRCQQCVLQTAPFAGLV